MGLHNIKRPNVKIKTKRLGKGNGSGYGKTAGRGHKGQKSRSGGNIPAWFEGGQMPIQRRLPKRGFKNRFRTEYRIVNLNEFMDLNETEYDVAKLENLGLIKRCNKNNYMPVKVLGKIEEFNKSITIKVNAFSKTAKEIIEKNGGKAEVV